MQLLREIKQNREQYTPWNSKEYTELYKRAELRISRERAYNLLQIMQLAIQQNGSVIEMGVYRGCTAYLICWLLQRRNIKKKVYLCDTFQGTPKMRNEEKGDVNRGGQYTDTSLEYVKNKLSAFSGNCLLVQGLIQLKNDFTKGEVLLRTCSFKFVSKYSRCIGIFENQGM